MTISVLLSVQMLTSDCSIGVKQIVCYRENTGADLLKLNKVLQWQSELSAYRSLVYLVIF